MTASASRAPSPSTCAPTSPILDRTINGGRLVYLDSSSTSQKPASVLAALDDFYRHHNANIHRGVYVALRRKPTPRSRARVSGSPRSLRWPAANTIFTRNVTEAINLVAYSWARTNLRAGDAVLISEMEHHSNIVLWQLATQATGAELRYSVVIDDGMLVAGSVDPRAGPRRRRAGRADPRPKRSRHDQPGRRDLVHRAQQGRRARADRRRAGGAAAGRRPDRDRRRLLCVDRAQGARSDRRGRAPRARRAARADAAVPCRGGHDRDGRGAALDLERAALEVRGGDLDDRPGDRARGGDRLPRCARDGTGARACEHALTAYALERLRGLAGVSVYGPQSADERGGVVSFALAGIHPHDVAELLSRTNVCIRASHHCAQPRDAAVVSVSTPPRAPASAPTTWRPTSTRWRTRSPTPRRSSPADGRPLPRLHSRALQAPAQLRRAHRPRPRSPRGQPAVRR